MAKAMLTAAAIAKLKPSKRVVREISDAGCPALRLVIQPSGSKSWAMRFRRIGGQQGNLTLGPVDLSNKTSEPVIGAPLTLPAARALAAEVHRQRAMGIDVIAVRHRERLEREGSIAKTFAAAVVDFVSQHAMRNTRRWQEQARLLGVNADLSVIPRGLVDRWRDRDIASINGDDIHLIVDVVRHKGVPGRARRAKGPTDGYARSMHSALSKLFNWLVEKRRLQANPCAGVHVAAPSKPRERVLSDNEIIAFWKACDSVGLPLSALLRLLLLTGCRLNEVAGMRRAELSEDGATWTIPGTRVKNSRTHVVPLSALAQQLLTNVKTESDAVFAISCGTRERRKLDAHMNIPAWTLHDLRRTAATGMAELGIAPHIVEACLNHVSGAKAGVAGVYNKATYAVEKRAALERWSNHILGLLERRPSNVVTMQKKVADSRN
jgi:integrase